MIKNECLEFLTSPMIKNNLEVLPSPMRSPVIKINGEFLTSPLMSPMAKNKILRSPYEPYEELHEKIVGGPYETYEEACDKTTIFGAYCKPYEEPHAWKKIGGPHEPYEEP